MQFHNLKPVHKRRRNPAVGRGGKRGKTSGRGTKGQKARAGRKIRPEARDVIKRLPKLRGRGKHTNKSIAVRPAVVSLSAVEAVFAPGEEVTPAALIAKNLVERKSGRVPAVKILGGVSKTISNKLTVRGCLISASARRAVEAAGGSVVAAPGRLPIKPTKE